MRQVLDLVVSRCGKADDAAGRVREHGYIYFSKVEETSSAVARGEFALERMG
jgi:hypothetical protein